MENLTLKYRPTSFAEVVGQPVIASVLSRQIETKQIRHAYLFAGPSGCGKTTTARIFAREINDGQGEPIEIDAASNNGVDYIRQISLDAQQVSIDSEFKVYIIDEVHMLSSSAFNAALKLIEEPPMNVVFILCTTNPEKIPETILTRVQRFDFARISVNDIADRLEFIINEEVELVTKFDRVALERIAVMSNGFMREAISLLDKCIAYSTEITLENVETCLGLVKYDLLVELYNAIVDKKLDISNKVLAQLKSQNSNLLNILDSILKFFIDCAKLQKFNNIQYTSIPESYKALIKFTDDAMLFVDRAFRYRTTSNSVNVDTILNILILELCNR